jgi:hypothetical protein
MPNYSISKAENLASLNTIVEELILSILLENGLTE